MFKSIFRWSATYAIFLHADIRKMHENIVQLGDARIVLDSAKTAKAQFE